MGKPARSTEELMAAAERVRAEGPIPLAQAAKLVPAANRRGYASTDTLSRWIRDGCEGVFLDAALFAGKGWWTSKTALERFLAARAQGRVREERGPTVIQLERERDADTAALFEMIGE